MVALRDAKRTDAGAVGAILSGFIDDTPWMPRIHSRAEELSFAGVMVDHGWVRVADCDGTVVGFLTLKDDTVQSLYLSPQMQGRGLGKALLDDAKARSDRLDLFVFQANTRAHRFYQREGFAEISRSDGSGNDEGLPDIHMRWLRGGQEERVT